VVIAVGSSNLNGGKRKGKSNGVVNCVLNNGVLNFQASKEEIPSLEFTIPSGTMEKRGEIWTTDY